MKTTTTCKKNLGLNLLSALLLLAFLLPVSSLAAATDMQEKLGIRSVAGDGPPVHVSDNLNIKFTPTQQTYRVNDGIEFTLKGDRDFFLYLFSINDNNEAILLIPGKTLKNNKYEAHKTYRVPTDKRFEFYSDKPGKERVIMFASTKWIDPKTSKYKAKGEFLVSTEEAAEVTIKGLRVRATNDKIGQNVQRVDINVVR